MNHAVLHRLLWQSPVGAVRLPVRGAPSLRSIAFFRYRERSENMSKPPLTLPSLKEYATEFLRALSELAIDELYGTTDGKAVGTFVEHAFHKHLAKRFDYDPGNAASGIDFPELMVDLKVTSARQPQSSCPFRDASQKVYGLGYHLLIFVYKKEDDPSAQAARLSFRHAVFVRSDRTADFQTTHGILEILRRNGNHDDLVAFLEERNLPLDEIGRNTLADRIMKSPPAPGVLTMSNALQWRLQYGRTLTVAGSEDGVDRLL